MKNSAFRWFTASCLVTVAAGQSAWPATVQNADVTRSPIRHLIVVSGENRGFDHIFGTYTPPDKNQQIWNLLSREIVQPNGSLGLGYAAALQQQAISTDRYELSPKKTGPYKVLPQPSTGLNALPASPCTMGKELYGSDIFCSDPSGLQESTEYLLRDDYAGTGQFGVYLPPTYYPQPDCRYPKALPNGPYSIVGAGLPKNDCEAPPVQPISYAGDPVHRFYQMWQQSDCSSLQATPANPSGCLGDLHTWVATSVGWDITQPPATDQDTYQGSVAMGFYNMQKPDEWPFLKKLADYYAISDNYHQPVMGGTGASSQFMLTGDVFYYTNAKGRPVKPNPKLIENPNPIPGTNNFYINDAFGQLDAGSTGVAYTNCSDENQPGVKPIKDYLRSLPYKPFKSGNCTAGRWYQVNNNYPYYNTDGSVISFADQNAFPGGPAYAIGPQTIPTIGDALARRAISWKYYGAGMKKAKDAPPANGLYCSICNGFQYAKSIMTSGLKQNLVDLEDFYADVATNRLPAVSFVKPDELLDGHPGSSTPALFEGFITKLVESVQAAGTANNWWEETAILITFDEGGGYYDSGYIQPIDFFGDGPRTIMIAVSPHAKKGHVDHTYADHASILKFIEWNWRLKPLSKRSRDNLPNPVTANSPAVYAPYIPINSPAIGDLRTMFDFPQP